jgi:ActR/RegA family two-component response regulator
VLLIDDDDDEAALTRSLSARVQDIQYGSRRREGLAAIARDGHDAYRIDQNLGGLHQASIVSRLDRSRNQLAGLVRISGSSSPR